MKLLMEGFGIGIVCMSKDGPYARSRSGHTHYILAYDRDRQPSPPCVPCWCCHGVVNMRGLKRLEIQK